MNNNNDNNDKQPKSDGGLYGRINMSLKTADIIITVLILALVATVIVAIDM